MRSFPTLIAACGLVTTFAQSDRNPGGSYGGAGGAWTTTERIAMAGGPPAAITRPLPGHDSPVIVRWEFGDGSVSHVMPPRPWNTAEVEVPSAGPCAPYREHLAGSPSVADIRTTADQDTGLEPRPALVSAGGQPVLVTVGTGDRRLAFRRLDPLVGHLGEELIVHRAAGRWAVDPVPVGYGPIFLSVRDLATGERWRESTH